MNDRNFDPIPHLWLHWTSIGDENPNNVFAGRRISSNVGAIALCTNSVKTLHGQDNGTGTQLDEMY